MVHTVLKGLGGLVALLVIGVAGYAGYASATTDSRIIFADTPFPDIRASSDPEVIARGRYLTHGPAHCSQCHSTPDRDHPEQILTHPLTGGLEFAMGPIATTWSANLTPDPETGIGRRSDAELARAIRHSVMPDGTLSILMRFSAARLSDEDLTAVVSYLRSIPAQKNEVRTGEFGLLGKMVLPLMAPKPNLDTPPTYVAAAAEPTVERGAYLADSVMLCTACHTAYDPVTVVPTGPKGAGSAAEPSRGADSHMEYVAPNLTSDPSGVTGRLDEDAFVARLRAGRVYASSIMPWENFGTADESDLRSVYRYLRTLPPVANDLGPSYREAGSWVADAK